VKTLSVAAALFQPLFQGGIPPLVSQKTASGGFAAKYRVVIQSEIGVNP
jgi:hypothetical protein